MLRVLRRALALPSPRILLLNQGLAVVDDQAVALASALAAYGAVPQSRSTAGLARCRQFFIHLVRLHLSGRQPPAVVPARDRLPKGLPRGGKRRGMARRGSIWAN